MDDLVEVLREPAFRHALGSSGGHRGAVAMRFDPGPPPEVFLELLIISTETSWSSRWRERLDAGPNDWPAELAAVQLLWAGTLRRDQGPDAAGWWLRVGPLIERGLALDVARCLAWPKGSPVMAELGRGGLPRLNILEPERVRATHLEQAWRAFGLVAVMATNAGRAGRRRGYLPGVRRTEFVRKYRALRSELGAAPTQAQLAAKLFCDESTLRRALREHGLAWPPA